MLGILVAGLSIFAYFHVCLTGSVSISIPDLDSAIRGDFEFSITDNLLQSLPGSTGLTSKQIFIMNNNKNISVLEKLDSQTIVGTLDVCNYTKILDIWDTDLGSGKSLIEMQLLGKNGYIERVFVNSAESGPLDQIIGNSTKSLHELAPFGCEAEYLKVIKSKKSKNTRKELRLCQIKADSPGVSKGLQYFVSTTEKKTGDWLLTKLDPKPEGYTSELSMGVFTTANQDRLAFAFYEVVGSLPAANTQAAKFSTFSDESEPVSESLITLPDISAITSLQIWELGGVILATISGVPTKTDSTYKEILQICTIASESGAYSLSTCKQITSGPVKPASALNLKYSRPSTIQPTTGVSITVTTTADDKPASNLQLWEVKFATTSPLSEPEVTGPTQHWSAAAGQTATVITDASAGALREVRNDVRRGVRFTIGDEKYWDAGVWVVADDRDAVGVWGRFGAAGWMQMGRGGCVLSVGGMSKAVRGLLSYISDEELASGKIKKQVNLFDISKQVSHSIDVDISFKNYDLKLFSSNFSQHVVPNEYSKLLWKDSQVIGGPFSIQCSNDNNTCKMARTFNKLQYHVISNDASPSLKKPSLNHTKWFGSSEILVDISTNSISRCILAGFETVICQPSTKFLPASIPISGVGYLYDYKITEDNIYAVLGVQTDPKSAKTLVFVVYSRQTGISTSQALGTKLDASASWTSPQVSLKQAESPLWSTSIILITVSPSDATQPTMLHSLVLNSTKTALPTITTTDLILPPSTTDLTVSNHASTSQKGPEFTISLSASGNTRILTYYPANDSKDSKYSKIEALNYLQDAEGYRSATSAGIDQNGLILDKNSKFMQLVTGSDKFSYTRVVRNFENKVDRVSVQRESNRLFLLPAMNVYKLGVFYPVVEENQTVIFEQTQDAQLPSSDPGKFYESEGKVYYKSLTENQELSWVSLNPADTYLNHTDAMNTSKTTIYVEHSLSCRTPVELQEITTKISQQTTTPKTPSADWLSAHCKNSAASPSVCAELNIDVKGAEDLHFWRLAASSSEVSATSSGRFNLWSNSTSPIISLTGLSADNINGVLAGFRDGRLVLLSINTDGTETEVFSETDAVSEAKFGAGGSILGVSKVGDGLHQVVARLRLEHGGGDGLFWAQVAEKDKQASVEWKRIGNAVLQSFETGIKVGWSKFGPVLGLVRNIGLQRHIVIYSVTKDTNSLPVEFGLYPYDYAVLASPQSSLVFVINARNFAYEVLSISSTGSIKAKKSVSPLLEFESPPSFLQCNILPSLDNWECYTTSGMEMYQLNITSSIRDEDLTVTTKNPKYAIHKNLEVLRVEASLHNGTNNTYLLVSGVRNVGQNSSLWRESFSLSYYPRSINNSKLTYATGALLADDFLKQNHSHIANLVVLKDKALLSTHSRTTQIYNLSNSTSITLKNIKYHDALNTLKLIFLTNSDTTELKLTTDSMRSDVEYKPGEKIRRVMVYIIIAVSCLILTALAMIFCTRPATPKHEGQIYYDGSEELLGNDATLDKSHNVTSKADKTA